MCLKLNHSATAVTAHERGQQQPGPTQEHIVPTLRDVLNGRGMGVQHHPGNEKYRALVLSTYAKCPSTDKMKISKGNVASVRELGGRFLQWNKCTKTYNDIGDQKAFEKTSQALREGLTKVRKQRYKDEGMASSNSTYDSSMFDCQRGRHRRQNSPSVTTPIVSRVPASTAAGSESRRRLQARQAQKFPQNADAMAMALDQFPGTAHATAQSPVIQEPAEMPSLPPPKQPFVPNHTGPLERIAAKSASVSSLGRLTDMSVSSVFSQGVVHHLLGLTRPSEPSRDSSSMRGSVETITTEMLDLLRISEPQTEQVHNMEMNETDEAARSGDGVTFEDTGAGEDWASNLKFTPV
ncbi:hypothetical protein ACHAWF_007127 [Thalassiosira exigua]